MTNAIVQPVLPSACFADFVLYDEAVTNEVV
jgi:hypothetical protein